MKKYLLLLCFGVLFACGDVSTNDDNTEMSPNDDISEVDGVKQASWCFGFPYKVLAFPQNQGSWIGSAAGQNAYALFWNNHCPVLNEEYAYFQDDGEINLVQSVGWSPNTCWTWKNTYNSGVVCNGQSFQCPANACLTLPAAWQLEANPPLNATIWNWVNPNESAAPGRHGIWPKVPTQCSSAVATPQFNPNGSGGTTLACKYPMGAYYLKQF